MIEKEKERAKAAAVKDAENLKLKASWVEGSIYDAAGTEQIAKIPSKETLIAQVLGGFNSPITALALIPQPILPSNASTNSVIPCSPTSAALLWK